MKKIIRIGLLAVVAAGALSMTAPSKAWGRRRAYSSCERCCVRCGSRVVRRTYRYSHYRPYGYWGPGAGVYIGGGVISGGGGWIW